jgi:Spore cortex protein YabQ (Spore_YabQ).
VSLSIRAQTVSLLLALALGAALGLLYDLLRPIRRRGGDTLWDILFCLAAAAFSFLFAMRSEAGVLGTGELLLSLLGLLLYFQLMSPMLCPIMERCARKIGVIWIFAQSIAKKVPKTAKKLFQNSQE